MKIFSALWLALLLGVTAIPQANAAANLLTNGSFEDPPGINPYQSFSPGESFPGWTIENGTVEITAGTHWQAAAGAQSLDLNGIFDLIGTISQDFATIPGQSYTVRFAYAGNPECGLPTLKTANAYWNSQLLTNLAFDITGYSNTDVGWIYYEQTVTATSSNSQIRFQATSPTFCGLTLDDVSVTALDIGPTNGCIDPPAGVVSWWRGEGNGLDSRGTNHGALQSGASFATGVAGQGFRFDGASGSVNVPAAISLDVGLSQGMSFECWIKPDDITHAQPLVEWFQGVGPPWGVHFWISEAGSGPGPGCLYVNVMDVCGAEHKIASAAGIVGTNQWQHVAITYDKATGLCRLFHNGKVVASENLGSYVLQTSYPLYLGYRPDGMFSGAPYRGGMDEAGLYNRSLSTDEIQEIYAAGSLGNCGGTNPPPQLLAVPVIAGFNPVSATVGSTVTLAGTNFSPAAASNIVFFGAVRAAVVSASVNNLTVTVPTGATYAPITLTVSGLVAYAAQPFQPTFSGDGTNITTASFAPRFDLAGGDGPHRSVIADLDGDGKPDIAVADVYGHTISLFRNVSSSGSLSNGSFAPRVVLPAEGGASDNPYGFFVADVDGDSKPDLVACDRLGNHISVYRNLAIPGSLDTGSFAPHVNFSVGADPRYARVADLDGDGRPDLVSANYAANTISILRNIGSAGSLDADSFAPAVSLPAGSGPYDVVVGDLDGDGKPDLAVVCTDGPTLSLYRNLAAPGAITPSSFAARVDLEALAGNDTIALGDIDGDGKSDLVFGSYQSQTMSVFRNQANPGPFTSSSFAPRVDFSNGNWTHNVALGDLNGDGKTDIVTVGELDSYLSVFQNFSTPGSFTTASLAARVDFGSGWNAWGLSIGDLDGDGRPDMVFCNAYDDTVSIYQNLVPFTNALPQTNVCVTPPSGLIGWWQANGSGVDLTGSHDGAFPYGMAYATGVVEQAFDFDWSARRVSIPDHPAFILTNALTLEAWVYPRAYGGFICFRGDNRPGLDNWFLDTYQPGYVNFGIIDEANHASMVLAPLALNQWQHIAATWDRFTGDMKVYVNGGLAGQTNSTLIPVGVLDPGSEPGIGIGNHGGTFHQFPFNGLIDELAIYSRALSAVEVAAIHVAGSMGKCVTNSPPTDNCVAPPSGLVSSWPAEASALDGVSGNHGALGGDATFAPGRVGTSFVFDGAGDGVNLGNPAGLQLQNFTIEAWIQRGSDSICSLDQDLGPGGVMLSYGYGGYGFGVFDNGQLFLSEIGISYVGSSLEVVDTNFHHVAVTKSGGAVVFYLDGVAAPVAAYDPPFSFGAEVTIGAVGAERRNSFLGRVDELAVFNRALSPSEIQAIHAAGSAGKCVVSNPPPPAYLLTGPITNSANGHWYYLLDATNWPAAEQIAVSLGGHLVTINNAAENDWVFTNFSNFGGVERALWLGLNDAAQENIWYWVSGEPGIYFNWAPGEPNSGGGYFSEEDHALMWHPSANAPAGSWNDAPSNQLYHAVVEIIPPESAILAGPITNWMNGHWYYLLDSTNWPAAEAIAISLGGHLATINNAEENLWVYDTFSTYGGLERPLWIGLTDAAEEGTWRWVSGEATTFLNWAAGEPNSGAGVFPDEDHAMIWHPSSGFEFGTWNDGPSNHHEYAVVEVDPLLFNHPPVAGIVIAPLAHLPGISNLLVITPACAPAKVILDGSRSTDADRDALQFSWSSGTTSWATGLVVTNQFNAGLYAIGLHVSDGVASDSNSTTLQVITPVQAVGILSNLVHGAALETNWNLFLNLPLRGAALAFGRCDSLQASNQLAAFRSRVEMSEGMLGAELMAQLLAGAQTIMNSASGIPTAGVSALNLSRGSGVNSGEFRLRFTGEPGRIYFIEATSDWLIWETVGVAADLGDGAYEFVDVNAGRFPGRYYRTVSP